MNLYLNNKKRNIAIFGGSFNPPHIGHKKIAKLIAQKYNIEVWIIPCLVNPLKKNNSDFDERLEICKKYFQHPKFKIINIKKLSRKKIIYNFDLYSLLVKKFYDIEFFWVFGSDILTNLHKWKKYDFILRHKNFIFLKRHEGFYQHIKSPAFYYLQHVNNIKQRKQLFEYNFHEDISSTKLRNM